MVDAVCLRAFRQVNIQDQVDLTSREFLVDDVP
jgi:hypothetical protein